MLKQSVSLLLFIFLSATCYSQQGFKESQQSYSRVQGAYEKKGEQIQEMLTAHNLNVATLELYLLAFKQEKLLEVWARNKGDERFSLLTSYEICKTSGIPGPKRMQGDLQIPEGFYHISAWNPWSNFHLSMCINYPNPSDRILGVKGKLGGDICIHGSCVTIGCLPLTDEPIKELYILCVETRNNGQSRIPLTIYPARLSQEKYSQLMDEYSADADRLDLWKDLFTAYQLFISTKQLPEITFLADGRHSIN